MILYTNGLDYTEAHDALWIILNHAGEHVEIIKAKQSEIEYKDITKFMSFLMWNKKKLFDLKILIKCFWTCVHKVVSSTGETHDVKQLT